MKNVWSLVRVFAKTRLRGMQQGGGSRGKRLMMGLVVGIALLQLVFYIGFIISMLLQVAVPLGLAQIPLCLGMLVACALAVFEGMMLFSGEVLTAKDAPFLASLPVKTRHVFLAKFIWMMLLTWALCLPAYLVTVGCYVYWAGAAGAGLYASAGIAFYLKALVIALMLPALPLAIAVIPSLIMMQILKLCKNRDGVMMVLNLVLLVAIMAGSMSLSGSMAGLEEPGAVENALNGLLSRIVGIFPPGAWAAQALILPGVQGLLWLLAYVGISLVSIAVVYALGAVMYPKTASLSAEAPAKAARKSAAGSGRRRSAASAIALKEWRVMMRSPVYAMNCLSGMLIGPIILLMPLFMNGGDGGLDEVGQMIGSLSDNAIPWLVLAGLLCFISGIQPGASTCLSREGGMLWHLRTLPLDSRDIVRGKWRVNQLLCTAGTVLTGVIAALVYHMPAMMAVYGITVAVAASVPLTLLSMLIDFMHPKLVWDNETEAIKQNMNALVAMGLGMVFIGVLAAISIGLYRLALPQAALWACLVAICALAAWVLHGLLLRAAKKALDSANELG
nr:hypothetical protein [bacterium]